MCDFVNTVDSSDGMKINKSRTPNVTELDKALYSWFVKERHLELMFSLQKQIHKQIHLHLLVHIFLPLSEKHALFLVDEYHQSNIAVTFCTFLWTDFIFHTNTEIRFMFKSTNDETITGSICEINNCT